jgi:sulfotransferase family protein
MPSKRAALTKAQAALRRATGYELRRATLAERQPRRLRPDVGYPVRDVGPEPRLLSEPVFLISSIRSGSTLLRMMLDSHSRLHAPHELHLHNLRVHLRTNNTERAMAFVGLDRDGLEHLLWDRLLDRELKRSGKEFLVNKTPSDAFIWRRIAECWPDARFVFLLRHPLSIVRSRAKALPGQPLDDHISACLRYMDAVEEARSGLSGLTVRYEALTSDPAEVTKGICDFLGLDWEPGMLEYGTAADRDVVRGLGDWTERIRSGTVQPPRPLPAPEEIPPALLPLCRAWGYL